MVTLLHAYSDLCSWPPLKMGRWVRSDSVRLLSWPHKCASSNLDGNEGENLVIFSPLESSNSTSFEGVKVKSLQCCNKLLDPLSATSNCSEMTLK